MQAEQQGNERYEQLIKELRSVRNDKEKETAIFDEMDKLSEEIKRNAENLAFSNRKSTLKMSSGCMKPQRSTWMNGFAPHWARCALSTFASETTKGRQNPAEPLSNPHANNRIGSI